MTQPNRQQRRTVAKKTAKSVAPDPVPASAKITDEEDQKRLRDLDKQVAEAKKDLGKQYRVIQRLKLQRDHVALAADDATLGNAQMQLMFEEQRCTDLAQKVINQDKTLRDASVEIARKYGMPAGDPNSGPFTIDLNTLVITKVG